MVLRGNILRAGLVCFIGLPIGCSTINNQVGDILFIPNPNSDHRTEIVELEIAYSDNKPCDDSDDGLSTNKVVCNFIEETEGKDEYSLMSGFAAEQALELAKSVIKRAVADESKRYTADFNATSSGANFYHFFYPSTNAAEEPVLRDGTNGKALYRDVTDVSLAGFRLDRRVNPKARKEDRGEVAMRLCMIALPSYTDRLIRVIPVSYDYRLTKAKLIGFNMLSPLGVDLLNPWEAVTNAFTGGYDMPPADRDIDVGVSVYFEHFYYLNGTLKLEQTNTETFSLSAVRISGESDADRYFPEYEKFLNLIKSDPSQTDLSPSKFELPCDETATPKRIAKLRDDIMKFIPLDDRARIQLESSANPFPSTPRTFAGSKFPKGKGNFKVTVKVTETDDYGERIKEIEKTLYRSDSSSDGASSGLWDSIKRNINPE